MATREEIDARVKRALVAFGAPASDIVPDTKLETLDIDSLDIAELADILSDEMKIPIEARDFMEARTVGDALAVIHARAGA